MTGTARVRTRRLLLSRPTAEDLPAVRGWETDPEAHRHDSGARTPEQAAELLQWCIGHWEAHGFGYWIVRESATGAPIGMGGVQAKELDGEPVLNLFYRLTPGSWGRGYAVELGRAVLCVAARHAPQRPVVVVTDVGNAAARRVAERLGLTHYREGPYLGAPCAYYRA